MKNLITFLIFALFLFSCSEKNILNLRIDNVNGLEEGAFVFCKGKQIGKVSNISFVGRELNVQIELMDNFKVPKNSEIRLFNTDLLGTKAIEIKLSENKEFYSKTDTVMMYDFTKSPADTIIKILLNKLGTPYHE